MQKKKNVEYNFGSIKDEFIVTGYDEGIDSHIRHINNIGNIRDKDYKVHKRRIK